MKFITLLVLFSLVPVKLYAQLDSVVVHYKLDTTKAIDFYFDEIPEETSTIEIRILHFASSKSNYTRLYDLNNSNNKHTFKKSRKVSISNINRTWESHYFLFYIQYLGSDGSRVSDQYYSHEKSKSKFAIAVDIDEVELKNKKENHNFFGSFQTSKDVFWRIRFMYETFETASNQTDLPALQVHWVTTKSTLDSLPLNGTLRDQEVITSSIILSIPKSYVSLSTQDTDQVEILDIELVKPCKLLFRKIPVFAVPIKKVFDHPEVKEFNYLSQKDTLIDGSMLRKIDFEVTSTLDGENVKLQSNVYLLGWYMQNGISSESIKLDAGTTRFSLVYPSRFHCESMKSMRVELKAYNNGPFKPSIKIPYEQIEKDSYEFLKLTAPSYKKRKNIWLIIFTGDYNKMSKHGIDRCQSGLIAKSNVNINKDEVLSFVFVDLKTEEIIKTIVLPYTSKLLKKRKISFTINDELILKYKIEKGPYLPPNFESRKAFSDYNTDMGQAMEIPFYKNNGWKYIENK